MSWLLRPRKPSEPVTGGNLRIYSGLFSENVPEMPQVSEAGNLYAYHAGDVFDPGSPRYVFEPQFELPLFTIWGKAFTRVANTFNPIQGAQVYAHPHLTMHGLGGLQAGYLQLQPLLTPDNNSQPFSNL